MFLVAKLGVNIACCKLAYKHSNVGFNIMLALSL